MDLAIVFDWFGKNASVPLSRLTSPGSVRFC